MTTKRSSGFTLIELLVVVAIIGIISSIGVVSYQGYVSGTRQKSTENAMQQISLAQTEEYSNTSSYHISTTCGDPSKASSDAIEAALFGTADIITEEMKYYICIEETAGGSSYIIKAKQTNGDKTITLSANGVWTGK